MFTTTDNPAASPDTLLTQQQIAEMFGVSKRRVQQIEQRALRKIRDAAVSGPYLREWISENVWLPEWRERRAEQ